jgi:hypothetical protein
VLILCHNNNRMPGKDRQRRRILYYLKPQLLVIERFTGKQQYAEGLAFFSY